MLALTGAVYKHDPLTRLLICVCTFMGGLHSQTQQALFQVIQEPSSIVPPSALRLLEAFFRLLPAGTLREMRACEVVTKEPFYRSFSLGICVFI